jgi:zinc-ribbon domain
VGRGGRRAGEAALVCPGCGREHPPEERFCERCGLPLVRADAAGEDMGEDARHRTARKIDPRYAEGEPRRVIGARNQAEAEFIQGLLLEEGIPSMLRRARGFDVPDFLASGPRDVLVPASGLSAAREVLLQSDLVEPRQAATPIVPWHVLAVLIAALVLVAIAIVVGLRL